MKIFYNGCSWTSGRLDTNEEETYPKILFKNLGGSYVNIAKAGASNQRILRTTYENCDESFDLAIIQMTFKDRFEFASELRKDGYISLLPNKLFKNKDSKESILFKEIFYRHFYTETYGDAVEKVCFQALSDYFYRIKVPVILTTINHRSTLPFHLKIIPKDYSLDSTYHPNKLGHNMLAKTFLKKIEQCLNL